MDIHLVDGTYELFRMYYGAPPRRGPGGAEVGATVALLDTLVSLVLDEGATHVGVAFDTVIESFRNELFGGYKTGAGIEPALWSQFPLAERAARALGLVTWSMIDSEADDALATFAARAAADARVGQVRICTPDKDLAQCVRGDRVVLVDRRRKTVLDEAGVIAKHGVRPDQIADWLALVGDTADGIPGIPRWGEKSAAAVLARYPHLEDIPDDAAAWDVKVRGAAALAENLAPRRKEALLFRTLATLRTDVPLAEDVDALRVRGPDPAALDALRSDLGDPRAAERATALGRARP